MGSGGVYRRRHVHRGLSVDCKTGFKKGLWGPVRLFGVAGFARLGAGFVAAIRKSPQ